MKERAAKFLRLGLCVSCGKEKIYKGRLCKTHYENMQLSANQWYQKKGREYHRNRAQQSVQADLGWVCGKCSSKNENDDLRCWRCFENRPSS
jgi:hypothetical protein